MVPHAVHEVGSTVVSESPTFVSHSPCVRRCFGTTVAASSRAVARNLEEFQSTVGDDQEVRASGVQFHTESDTSNRFVQTLGESDTDNIVGMFEQGDGVEVIDAIPATCRIHSEGDSIFGRFCQL